ncbi:hypothetical protein BTUL_0065g00520 [Botrytis tulipae]|uniref:Galactose oxidase kelch beta-propeller n=1 Tax=Botrytis tulipae TaxID=87230 RepID=A0A4Z1EMV4_9HELO|nr:hypothetical protein BTUL_0065g00520 [Botrytis tulipae]
MKPDLSPVLWTLISLTTIANSQSLPYNPTTILLPSSASQRNDTAFIFLVASESDTRPEFLSLNISSTLFASNLTLEPFTPNLSFLDNNTAFIPTIGTDGEISLLTGSCSESASTELWTYTPGNEAVENGTWAKETTILASDVSSAGRAGAQFLSGGFQFSTLVNANASYTDIYIYGGMCPSPSANTSTWQSDANYTNHMMRISPGSTDSYSLDLTTNRGAPVSEAGFTITPLLPAYSNASGIMTQTQNFILLGGHTQGAFINMSQVAIWSLPEESWSFVTINPPSSTESSTTELIVKHSVTSVDSRSGHTAILTEDGSKVIVLGGWVGSVNQAADPQFAILELGTGYGGTGRWKWSVPTDQPFGDGIYGHGAIMLPGNVMMVLGGFNITAAKNMKRAVDTTVQPMFFNATSSTWISNYTNPAYMAANARSRSSSSSGSSKVALGVGLGLGIAAFIAIVAGLSWCLIRCRRRRRDSRYERREKDLRSLGYNAATAYPGTQEMYQNRNYSDRQDHYYDSVNAAGGYESLYAGENGAGEIGSPTLQPRQIPRKAVRNNRGLYQPASTFDPGSVAGNARSANIGAAGPIHPIYEADEDADIISPIEIGVALPFEESDAYFGAKRSSDPFKDPVTQNYSVPVQSNSQNVTIPVSESPAQEREREIEAWVADWAAADALLHAQARSHSTVGRNSPSRRANLITATGPASVSGELSEDNARTASNLSEQSMAPTAATLSRSGSSSLGTRSNSLRGYLTYAMNTISLGNATLSPMPDSPVAQNAQICPPGSSGSENTGSTYTTAHTHSSFPTLQAEAATLLPRPEQFIDRGLPSPTESSSKSIPHTPTRTTHDYIGSPSKNKHIGLGRRGWLGSLRKAFRPEGDTAAESSLADQEPLPLPIGVDNSPRRTVSAGAALWRRKQGRGDWEDSEKIGAKRGRSSSFVNGGGRSSVQIGRTGEARGLVNGIAEDDDEWDIERAIENRVVQVMFTVPKEKLRVVNHDVREDLSEGGSTRGRNMGASGSGTLSRTPSDILSIEDGNNLAKTESAESGRSKGRVKGKGKVSELVELLEGRSSPERQ